MLFIGSFEFNKMRVEKQVQYVTPILLLLYFTVYAHKDCSTEIHHRC